MSSAAFEALYTAEFARLHRYATRFLHDPDEAESLVQEVFARLWARWEELVDGRPLIGWLQATLRWECHHRSVQQQREWSLEYSCEITGHDYADVLDVPATVELAEEITTLAAAGQLRDVAFVARPVYLLPAYYSPAEREYQRMTAGFLQHWIEMAKAIRAERPPARMAWPGVPRKRYSTRKTHRKTEQAA